LRFELVLYRLDPFKIFFFRVFHVQDFILRVISANASKAVMGIEHEFAVKTVLRKPIRVAAHDVIAPRRAERIINLFRHGRSDVVDIHRAFALIDVRTAVDDVFAVLHAKGKDEIPAVAEFGAEAVFAIFFKGRPHRSFFLKFFEHGQEFFQRILLEEKFSLCFIFLFRKGFVEDGVRLILKA
jgi:hypothetical protein